MNSQILTATMMKDTREYRVSCLCVCVCVKTFCCCSTVMSKCAPKPILKLLKKKKEKELIFCKSHFERAKKKKNGKIEERVLKPQ